LRILQVITDLQTGGVPLHLLRLATFLEGRGESVRVVCLSPPGPVSRQLSEAGVAVAACHATGWWDWRAIERLASAIGDFSPHVVHALLFHANIAARIACPLSGFDTRRLICEVQTVEIERRWHLIVDRWTQHLCRWIVGNSPSVVEHLASRGRIARSRLRLIRGGVDFEAVASATPVDRRTLGLTDTDPLLLWVGRLDPIKGLDVLVQAAAVVNTTQPVHVAIVGHGPYRQELVHRIDECGLAGRVHLLGTRTDVPRLLKTADVFVFPSRTEGLPNALLEAMAAALPIVTTDVPGCRDLIEAECTGLLVARDDSAGLATAVTRILQDRPLAARLGRAAAVHVRRFHQPKQCFDSYRAMYRETVESADPGALPGPP
jgi:glycosyltransferase involved in cell wall biosynthesis